MQSYQRVIIAVSFLIFVHTAFCANSSMDCSGRICFPDCHTGPSQARPVYGLSDLKVDPRRGQGCVPFSELQWERDSLGLLHSSCGVSQSLLLQSEWPWMSLCLTSAHYFYGSKATLSKGLCFSDFNSMSLSFGEECPPGFWAREPRWLQTVSMLPTQWLSLFHCCI